jgi:hypothetical protein
MQAARWESMIGRRSSEHASSDAVPESLDAYALRQYRIWSRRIDVFLEAWVPTLDAAGVGQDWLAGYRSRYESVIGTKARTIQPTTAPPALSTSATADSADPASLHDAVDEVLSFAEEGVWEAERVEAWVPEGEAADNGEDTDGEASSDSEDDT